MTGIFKANNPYNNFLLLIYGLVLKIPMFINPHVPQPQQLDGFLYKAMLLWLKPIAANAHLVYSVITFLLLYIQAVSINKLINSQRLMQKPNYLSGMAYLLITSMFSDWFNLSSPLIVNTLLIAVLSLLSGLHNNNNPKSTLFNAGMIIGFSSFFYFPSIAFLLLIMVGLGITRPFRLPEWMMVLLGILAPYYFLTSWVFLTDKWKGYRFPGFTLRVPTFQQNAWSYAAVSIVSITIIIGIFFIMDNMRRQVVQARKSWNLIFLYLFVSLIVPFLNASQGFDYWILTAVPLAMISGSAFFYPERKIVPLFLHWCMVLIYIATGFF
ncbi:MAG: hypothetical protein KBF74_05735 [Ferruginibacter sp.]|nr:hypothetical protein [Ferruginibacter sp.]